MVLLEQKLKEVAEVVTKLSHESQLIPKNLEIFTLPIIKHNVTFHFTAAIKYNILEEQFLQFAYADFPKYFKKEDIQQRLGVTSEEMESMTSRLLKEQKIDVIQDEIHVKEKDGKSSVEKQVNLNRFSRSFELYYEPVTDFVVDNISRVAMNSSSKMHPAIVDDQYNFKNCAAISEDTILQSFKQATGEDLHHHFSKIMIESIESEAVETEHKIELMEFELIDAEAQKVIKTLYNPNQQKLIKL